MKKIKNVSDIKKLTLAKIGKIIKNDMPSVWNEPRDMFKNPLKQYLECFLTMESIRDRCGLDDGVRVVSSFLGVSKSWSGEAARVVQSEIASRMTVDLSPQLCIIGNALRKKFCSRSVLSQSKPFILPHSEKY